MSHPDYTSPIYNAQWPAYINNDGKDYFIFQIVNDQGFAADVLYRDMSLHGTDDLIGKVAKAWIEKRKLKIYLIDKTHMLVGRVELV